MNKTVPVFLIIGIFIVTSPLSTAGSATWAFNPTSGDWNMAANWRQMMIPNSPADTATFGASNLPSIFLQSVTINVNGIVFIPGASPYTISIGALNGAFLDINDGGVVNNSQTTQNFVAAGVGENTSVLNFFGAATAGTNITYTNKVSGQMFFYGLSSADNATFVLDSATSISFRENSTAANGRFTNGATEGQFGSVITFGDNSTAANGFFTNTGKASIGSRIVFTNNSTAGTATFINDGGEVGFGAYLSLSDTASADHGIFTFKGGIPNRPNSGAHGDFFSSATANEALITVEGSSTSGAPGASVTFSDSSTAGNSTLIASNGPATNTGGIISFIDDSLGGTARVELAGPVGSGILTIEMHDSPGVSIGSLEGAGSVILGANNLTIGSNNLITTFSGTMSDGRSGNVGGSLTKVGTGVLTLTGANTYTGGTTISGGTLVVGNQTGSATGGGTVNVNNGVLGGGGIIAGAVTVGTGTVLAPAAGAKTQTTLTIQGALTFNGHATYTYSFRARRNQTRTDVVTANGVTINSGAILNSIGKAQGQLEQGLTLMVINNTSATPISGTFGNLADGSIVIIGSNNLEANYEGGDGNDLTLTVVP